MSIKIKFVNNQDPILLEKPHTYGCLAEIKSRMSSNYARPSRHNGIFDVVVSATDLVIFKCQVCSYGIDICNVLRKATYYINHKTCSKNCASQGTIPTKKELIDLLKEIENEFETYQYSENLIEIQDTECGCWETGSNCSCIPHARADGLINYIYLSNLQSKLTRMLIENYT